MIRIITILAISIFTLGQGFAQNHVNYNRDTRWFIGLNVGGTWTTQTEVPYRLRGGYGLTFGKSFGMEPEKLFSWDIRARFLHAQLMGQSTDRYSLDSNSVIGLNHYGSNTIQKYQDSLGYFYSNYRTNLLRGSLELVLNTNRLRQRTGWNLSVFGGVGITGYHTATDIVQGDKSLNQTYDYNNLGNATVSNLLKFQDGVYETDLVGSENAYEVDWMPSFGFGISKQVLPGVAIGLEHKMTWTRTNLFDGMPNKIDGTSSILNDKYHYTALTIKFHLFHGERTIEEEDVVEDDIDVDVFDTNDNPPIIDSPTSKKKPIVDIYDPNSSPYTTTQGTFNIKANIYYVENRNDVTFKQDGNINTNFSFNPTTDRFESNVVLHPGQNLFEITGVNEAGSDYEAVIIIYQKEEEPRNPPIVTITNPPYSPYTTSSSVFGLVSTVLNVDSKSQIHMYLNGVNYTTFSYNLTSKGLNASLNLKEGVNTVTVTATNDVGSDSKTVEIIYTKPQSLQPPVVTFINPGVNPYFSEVSSINIRATALHVAKKADLTVLVNGNPITGFSFNTGTKEIYFSTGLLVGANYVEIIGVNEAGRDSETTTIIYNLPEAPRPPIVTFIDPNVNPITVYSSSYNVTAKVEYVSSKSNITLKINGVTTTLFTYSTSSDLMNFTTNLIEGSNVIEIKGTNDYGVDLETTTIIYKRTIPQAPPVVNITYPAVDNIEFASPNITLEASVLNVSGAGDINVWVNGIVTTSFTYNVYTKALTLPLVLNEGSNTVKITGTNVAGSDSKTRIIKYKKPLVPTPPTVQFINPPSSPFVVGASAYTITANTTNIDSKSQIVLKHNGVLISDALYSFVSGYQIVYNANLILGSNIFEVSVENAYGSDEDLAIINYERNDAPCIIPTVGYISPVPYSTVENPNMTIDAQINNHSVGTTVELKLNGVSKGYMTYNAGTSIASKAIMLAEGSNAITVIVTNECGTNQATFTLNYEAPDAPCSDPLLIASGETTFSTLESVISLSLGSSYIGADDAISVKLNGSTISRTFDAGTGTITIPAINLNVGSNSLVISAKTDCGPAVLVYTITRDVCLAPVVSGISPLTGTSTESSSIVLTANVSNAISTDIVVMLNGVSQTFSYNADSDVLTKALSLAIGVNTISVQVTNACGTSTKSISITRTIPCATIVTNLLSPASGTVVATEKKYNITLHATGLSNLEQISAKLNGSTVPVIFDGVSGNISINGLNLIDGENLVSVVLINDCSRATVTYRITYNGCKPPVIVYNGVTPGMEVTEGVFNLGALITNIEDASELVLKVNGVSVDFDFNPIPHLLTASFTLIEGTNTIEIIANGCEKVKLSTTVKYKKPCDKITHTLMSPNTTSATALESKYNITLSTFGVISSDQIGVKLNGVTVPFAFNPATKIITISGINLKDGANSVIVTLKNDCSSDVINYTINYDGCEPPVISFEGSPGAVTTAAYNLEANVSNVAHKASIQVLHNGAPVTFTFDAVSGSIDATITLVSGANTFRILAKGCESATKDFVVTYTVPCAPITYSLINPNVTVGSEAGETYSISLIVNNLAAAGISVTKSGSSLPFTYVDNLLTINAIPLSDGANSIVVSLSNACSSESITYTITHDDCKAPVIVMTSNPLTTESSSYNFTATVSNIKDADDIILKLNGIQKDFKFDPVTGIVTAKLKLNEGGNAIQINAKGCVSASKSIRVTYTIPCAPVTYGLVSPSNLISDTEEESIDIRLNITNALPESISATLNGSAVAATYSGGVVTIASVALIEGSNSVVLNFGNTCSSESVTFTINHDLCEPPSVIINGLTDGMVMTDQELMFTATLNNVTDAGDIVLKFNGVAKAFEFNPMSKLLATPITLLDGSNLIEIIINGCTIVTEDLTLVYDEPCAAPHYTRITPAGESVTVDGDTYTISFSTENVTEEQVQVKVNGGIYPFTFSGGTVIITVPYISVPTNSVEVILSNDCGRATINYSITYNREEVDCTPTVSAVFGVDNKSVTATSNKDLINVILNLNDGSTQLITGVSGKTGTFSATGDKAGLCIVGVWIRSGCNISAAGEPFGDYVANPGWTGTCADRNPCLPITYSLVSPTRLSATTTSAAYSIVFSAKNITGPSDVIALVNGVRKSVTYSSGKVSLAGITLRSGSNTIQFTLTNACSTELITFTVSYTAPVIDGGKTDGKVDGKVDGQIDDDKGDSEPKVQIAPVISPITPTSTKVTVQNQTLNLKVRVENVSSKSDIELTLNGVRTTSFSYNTSSQQMAAVLSLKAGVNMIKIKARNGQTKELTYYVTYEKGGALPVDNGKVDGISIEKDQGVLTPELIRQSPASSTTTTDKETYLFKVKTVNIASKANVSLSLNGTNITNFIFNSTSKIVSATLRLKEGANQVRIEGRNGDKKTVLTFTITYKKPVQIIEQKQEDKTDGVVQQVSLRPTFKRVNPTGSTATVKSPTFVFKTTIGNVKSKGDITLLLNGVAVTDFTFDSTTGVLVATLTLNSGANTINVTAKNGDQSATIKYTITYQGVTKSVGGTIKTDAGGSEKKNVPANGGTQQVGGRR